MSSPLGVKRRRLNDATYTLTKPFVSPMRSTNADRKPLNDRTNGPRTPYTPSTLAHTVQSSHVHPEPSPLAKPRSILAPTAKTTSNKRRPDPAELSAQRDLTRLEARIRALRTENDTLAQAHQIASSSTDDELAAVAEKWRLASQQAAEELFGTVKERVCRMGGVVAWREQEKMKFERANGMGEFAQKVEPEDDDADCEFDSQGEELPEAEVEYRKKEKRRVRREAMDAADDGGGGVAEQQEMLAEQSAAKSRIWAEQGKEDDTFTMDMMLRSLNIELKVIGYDKHAQRWI
ncbi:hypothetical protein LTR53_001755 [Teratosphaeriaceae sp. CCFEE 6253]|nr:hypothetical protein LTR53_001755 [Teratosphaeriaceae sp. CCFEE 6253]